MRCIIKGIRWNSGGGRGSGRGLRKSIDHIPVSPPRKSFSGGHRHRTSQTLMDCVDGTNSGGVCVRLFLSETPAGVIATADARSQRWSEEQFPCRVWPGIDQSCGWTRRELIKKRVPDARMEVYTQLATRPIGKMDHKNRICKVKKKTSDKNRNLNIICRNEI